MKMKFLPLFLILLSSACAESFTRLSPSFAGLSFDVPNGWTMSMGVCNGWSEWSKDEKNGPDLGVRDAYLIDQTAEDYCAAAEKSFQKNGKPITKHYLPDLNGLKRLELTGVRSFEDRGNSEDTQVCYLIHWKPGAPVIVTVYFYFSAARAKEEEQIWNRIKESEEYSLDAPRSPIFVGPEEFRRRLVDFTVRVRENEIAGRKSSLPIPSSQPLPEYPYQMRESGVTGPVNVRFVVGKDGATSNIRVLYAPEKPLGDAVSDAVKHWTFIPSTTAIGEPAPLEMEYEISFNIQ